jgi:nucleoside-diphosphate-sugar epimerase
MLLRMLADAALMVVALFSAVALRFLVVVSFEDPSDLGEILRRDIRGFLHASWALTAISLCVFYLSGFYTYGKFYLGKYKLIVVSQAVSVAYLVFGFLWYFFAQSVDPAQQTLPVARGAFALAWGLSILLLGGARIWNQLSKHIVDPERESIIRANRTHRHVLVVGGAGYIGSALLPHLLNKGHRVRVLDLLLFGETPIAKYADSPNLEILRGDFRHVENVVEAMRDVDSVIHLGAIVGDPACKLDEDLTIDVNLSATRMLAQLAKAANVDRFLFASTCSVYGACDGMIDERSEVQPVSLYGHTKLASEDVLLRAADDRFAPTILRFATIYGLSGRTRFDLVINLMSAQAKIDGKITVYGGDQWRPFVHVEDAARGVALVLDAPREIVASQIFNVGSNEQNHTILQIGELVHSQIVGSRLVVRSDDTDPRNYRTSFNKIRNHLGFEPQWTIEKGIHQVLEAIAGGEVADYQDPRYSNVRFLTEEGTSSLSRDRWAHELIQTLTKQ